MLDEGHGSVIIRNKDDKCMMSSTVSYLRPIAGSTTNQDSQVISPSLTARHHQFQGPLSPFGNFSSSAIDKTMYGDNPMSAGGVGNDRRMAGRGQRLLQPAEAMASSNV